MSSSSGQAQVDKVMLHVACLCYMHVMHACCMLNCMHVKLHVGVACMSCCMLHVKLHVEMACHA
jgi:hypothetical protein